MYSITFLFIIAGLVQSLKVGLFKYVPNADTQCKALENWASKKGMQLDVTLFDPYLSPNSTNTPDVYMIDTILLPSYVSAGVVIPYGSDYTSSNYHSFAWSSSMYKGVQYGVPSYVCSNFLTTGPPVTITDYGLYMGFKGYAEGPKSSYSITTPYFDLTGDLPQDASKVNTTAAKLVKSVQSSLIDSSTLFLSNPNGKSFYGYSETFSNYSGASTLKINTVTSPQGFINFYTDIVVIKPELSANDYEKAKLIVRYLTSPLYFTDMRNIDQYPSYVTPALKEVLSSYSEPLYKQINALLTSDTVLSKARGLQFNVNDSGVKKAFSLIMNATVAASRNLFSRVAATN